VEGPLQHCLPTDTEIPVQFPTNNAVVGPEALGLYRESNRRKRLAYVDFLLDVKYPYRGN
jgi:hypothetical protein